MESCSHQAAALYLFLVTVADYQGISYYSAPSIMKLLSMDELTLGQARQNLIRLELIAYEKPLYQVLALDRAVDLTARSSSGQPVAIGQILQQIMGGAS
jgi:hypothetical protein